MKDAIVVLAPTNSQEENRTCVSEILFTKTEDWLKQTLNQLEITNIINNHDNTAKEIISLIENDDTISQVLFLGEDAPLITDEEIEESYSKYKKTDKRVVLYADGNRIIPGSGWYEKRTFTQLMSVVGERFSVCEVYSQIKELGISTTKSIVESHSLLPADDPINRNSLSEIARKQIIRKHLLAGVEIPVESGIIIAPTAIVKQGATIFTGSVIKGKTIVEENCQIGPNSVVENSQLGKGCKIISSYIEDSVLLENVQIGPMSRIRPGSHIENNVKVGNFVEIKNSNIGEGTKAGHLSYIGDSDVGRDCNFGCGTVTVNYDGKNKYRTTVGNRVFIGCNTNLVAPVTVEDGAFSAAGTTVTDDVPKDSLVIGRSKQTVKVNWCKDNPLFNQE